LPIADLYSALRSLAFVFALVSPQRFAAVLDQIGNWQSEIGIVVAAQPRMQNQIRCVKK
jgi:hypothetical protein